MPAEEIDSFENLLRQKENAIRLAQHEAEEGVMERNEYQKADKGCTLSDFLLMVKKIVVKGLKKFEVQFVPDDGPMVQDLSSKNDKPFIYYTLISRVPRNTDRKPRYRQDIHDVNPDGSIVRNGTINGQLFDCDIQFNIVAADYSLADSVMDAFEDAMLKYSGFFKRNGVSEMYFSKQYTDSNLDVYRQKMSIRSLVYRVTLERIRTSFDTTIAKIDQF